MPTNGRRRTLILCETLITAALVLLLVAMMIFVIVADRSFAVSWGTLGIAAAGTMGELVRRFRHLRTDLDRHPAQSARITDLGGHR